MRNPQTMKSQSTSEFLFATYVQLGQDIRLHWMDLKTLSVRCQNEGISFLTKTLPLLSKALIKGLATGQFKLPSNFKRKSTRSVLPAFLGSHFARVFYSNGKLRSDYDVEAIRQIRQFCDFAYKAKLPRRVEDDDKVIANFIEVEEELSSLEIPSDPLLVVSNALAHSIFSDFDPSAIICRNGPGVTANVAIEEKYESSLSPGLGSVSHFSLHHFFNVEDGMTRLHRYPVWETVDYFRCLKNRAKVLLVPKDSRGPRLISAEPFENQFVQQGIANYMVDKLETNPISAGHVNFTDQSINRTLAKENSVSLEYSTLDLKDASDRISMVLVRRIFDGLDLLQALEACRSVYTLLPKPKNKVVPDSDYLVRLSKHAPMGSAVCFPVLATCVYLLILSGLLGLGLSLADAIDSVYVYGDDVIVKTKYARFAIGVLERYALRVNTDKSFIGSRFLESCGMDAFDGQDITPVRLRNCDLCSNLLEEQPTVLVSLIETANLLSASGYRLTSEHLYKYSESWLGPLPYGHHKSPYICRLAPTEMWDLLPEMNFLRDGIRWFSRKNKMRYPLGSVMQAWALKPVTVNSHVTFYGHMRRIWGMLGQYESIIPRAGEFSLPRQVILSLKTFDHYAMQIA